MARPLPYFEYTSRSRIDKAINTLLGIIEGVSIDGKVNEQERRYLDDWVGGHSAAVELHPFSELIPLLRGTIADGVIDPEEREDLKWLCERLRSCAYYDKATSDLQRLQAILGGIAADQAIDKEELVRLRDWIDDHDHLRTLWPYDEVSSLVTGVLADGKIDASEHALLREFFGEFMPAESALASGGAIVVAHQPLCGVCASCPEIRFGGMKFCFTGESSRYEREQLVQTVLRLGGSVVSAVSGKVDYLVVGSEGNPCWAYACYGRKIEKAMLLRREGSRVLIVHENDFHDAVADRKLPR